MEETRPPQSCILHAGVPLCGWRVGARIGPRFARRGHESDATQLGQRAAAPQHADTRYRYFESTHFLVLSSHSTANTQNHAGAGSCACLRAFDWTQRSI